MNLAAEADRTGRRAQVIEALADAVATIDRAPPIHVAVEGLTDGAAPALADELSGVLAARGRGCRRAHSTRSATCAVRARSLGRPRTAATAPATT